MKAKFLFLFITSILLYSCEEPIKKEDDKEKQEDQIEVIEHGFTTGSKMDPLHLDILKELDICDMNLEDTNSIIAKCSPENFKIYPLSDKIPVQDAFLLQTKSAIVLKGTEIPLPVRHVMIFERENGQLVRIMGIRGEMIAMDKSKTDYKDIYAVIYYKKDDSYFNCKLTWDGTHYVFSVEAIDFGEGFKAVKASVKDSVSSDIYSALREDKMLF